MVFRRCFHMPVMYCTMCLQIQFFYFYFCQFQLHWTINKNRKIKPNVDIYMDIFTVKWFRPQGLRHIPIETNIYLLFFERLQLTSVTSWLTNLMRVTRTRLDTVSDFWPCSKRIMSRVARSTLRNSILVLIFCSDELRTSHRDDNAISIGDTTRFFFLIFHFGIQTNSNNNRLFIIAFLWGANFSSRRGGRR